MSDTCDGACQLRNEHAGRAYIEQKLRWSRGLRSNADRSIFNEANSKAAAKFFISAKNARMPCDRVESCVCTTKKPHHPHIFFRATSLATNYFCFHVFVSWQFCLDNAALTLGCVMSMSLSKRVQRSSATGQRMTLGVDTTHVALTALKHPHRWAYFWQLNAAQHNNLVIWWAHHHKDWWLECGMCLSNCLHKVGENGLGDRAIVGASGGMQKFCQWPKLRTNRWISLPRQITSFSTWVNLLLPHWFNVGKIDSWWMGLSSQFLQRWNNVSPFTWWPFLLSLKTWYDHCKCKWLFASKGQWFESCVLSYAFTPCTSTITETKWWQSLQCQWIMGHCEVHYTSTMTLKEHFSDCHTVDETAWVQPLVSRNTTSQKSIFQSWNAFFLGCPSSSAQINGPKKRWNWMVQDQSWTQKWMMTRSQMDCFSLNFVVWLWRQMIALKWDWDCGSNWELRWDAVHQLWWHLNEKCKQLWQRLQQWWSTQCHMTTGNENWWSF